jgi:hypothetical protein
MKIAILAGIILLFSVSAGILARGLLIYRKLDEEFKEWEDKQL